MALSVLELFQFGGVDSRSNPLNMPQNRALRMRNFAPQDSGVLQLRYGYSTVSMSTVSVAAFQSLYPYTLFDNSGNETKYLLMRQGTAFKALNIGTGAVTTPAVRGATLASAAKGSSYVQNNRIHFGNGADQKWFDGITLRDNGLRMLTAAEVATTVILPGSFELLASENTAVTLTPAAGGSFPATVGAGILFYVSNFDTAVNELGPATVNAGSGRVTLTANQKVTLAGLPSAGAKLISRTPDNLSAAYFCTNTSTAITSCTRAATTLTVISPTHGLSTGDIVVLSGTTNFDSVYVITVVDGNTFTATLYQASGQNVTGANTTLGTCKRIVIAANTVTTVDVLSPAQDTSIVVNDANRGVAIPSAGLANSGYQFYVSIYNPNGGGHVGNRITLPGSRVNGFNRRLNLRITGLPDLSGTDSEWAILIGRTGDGAEVPYACTDSLGNWMTAASGQTAITLTTCGGLDGTAELPTRNGIIPATLNMFSTVGDRTVGATFGRPYVYRSASQVDDQTGDFVGRPEQSWAPDDVETFPTAEGVRGIAEYQFETICGTLNDCAVLSDLAGILTWRGPWYGCGFAGMRSFCRASDGFYWVTGQKQLATFMNGVPVAISDEYEAALLATIGDAYLQNVEMAHEIDAAKRINRLVIKCQDSTGAPFLVYHDFRLRDGRSATGQGYDAAYLGPLAADFTLAKVRDAAGAQRLWAGASTGQIYQLDTGANDAGTEYSADALFLINGGPSRPSVPELRWHGDQNVVVSIGQTLDSTLDATSDDYLEVLPAAQVVFADDDNFHYAAKLDFTEIKHAYVRFQLDSHSVDGTLDLNSPPHIPLESYGRVYLVQGLAGNQRGPA